MGVPGFFIWLIKKYKNIIQYKLDDDINIDILFLDLNCLIHPQSQKALKKYLNWKDKDFIEEKMLDEMETYLDHLIFTVSPKKMVYLAVDGVAPCAKITQQRMRRFKGIKYRNQLNSLKRKHKIPLGKKWDNASITPGTEFMQKITSRLLKIIKYDKYKNIKIILSTGNTPGEGEHKILQHINGLTDNNNIVIYGLDADLIFLGLASQKNNVYLLREVQHFGKSAIKDDSLLESVIKANKTENDSDSELSCNDSSDDNISDISLSDNLNNKNKKHKVNKIKKDFIDQDFEELNYLSIDLLRERLYDEILSKINKIKPKKENIVNDFIFISYFMGNDFLPHIPSIDIKKKGLDILLECYYNTIGLLNVDDNKYISLLEKNSKKINSYYSKNIIHFLDIHNRKEKKYIKINIVFLKMFLKKLSEREDEFFIQEYKKPKRKRFCFSTDLYEIDKFKLDNLQFKINDPIMLGKDSSELWKKRYYKHYFFTNEEQEIDNICKEFLNGLLWVSKYYLDKCCSWNWYYPFNNAPMISDIYNFIERNDNYYIDNKIFKGDVGKPLDPFIQLLSVLHPSCNYLLPKNLRYLMLNKKSKIIDLYPHRFNEDLIGKSLLWKCTPKLPKLDIDRIKKNVSYKYISEKEMERNIIKDIYTN